MTPEYTVIGTILPITISITAIAISIITAQKSEANFVYSSLDKMYTELMKTGVDNPDFRDPQQTINYKTSFSGTRLFAYESYAFMAMNLAATVHDRYKKIHDTWNTIITLESELHKSWFYDNSHKFKPEFVGFIKAQLVSRTSK
ncbi:hypothetical protein [Candidatus Nitrosotenuis aquarius]|uniref:hypothetical protein n=1 Tax=Candidatus Nitrosotenuis aquarius TaxID=1846278 RepID=UPI000C1F2FC5|nr:hypothetical protein [Candidatus Nitrosotenuis aquarius]